MAHPIKLAVAGIGNNISALYQGADYYREMRAQGRTEEASLGVRCENMGGLRVEDIEFVAAFDVHPDKVGKRFSDAVLAPPNNYPVLDVPLTPYDFKVEQGFTQANLTSDLSMAHIVDSLRKSGAEVLLYSLPTGLQWAAEAYAQAALLAGVAIVNCTPEKIARDPEILARFEAAGVPCVGDDLASHLGASVVHRTLLGLIGDRGLTLRSTYQLNFGGNEDFRNLRDHGASKAESKINALRQKGLDTDKIQIIPSAGYVNHLQDNKVAIINIEGYGWAARPVSLDLKLKVQDSSNAAGVIIDLIRIAALAYRKNISGFPLAAASCLKSPSCGHENVTAPEIQQALTDLQGVIESTAAE
jgi:myo-inositol-1-phosphate synthase